MAVSQNLIEFVKSKEGFRSSTYWDVDHYAYGYGQHAPHKNATITESEASNNLTARLASIQTNIQSKYGNRNWNQNQLDALTSFTYNLGDDSLNQLTSNNTRSDAEIAKKMLLYTKSNGVSLSGLESRRSAESAIFSASAFEVNNIYESVGVTPVTGAVVNPALVSSTEGLTGIDTQSKPTLPTTDKTTVGSNLPDESIDKDTASTETKTPSVFEVITLPRPNKFQIFATMSYAVSLYLLNPEDYKSMMKSGNKSVSGLTLFIQSGGISLSKNDIANFGAERSKYFMEDFYLDDIQLEGLVSGTSTAAANNVFKLNFKVTEPAGLTFLERLYGMIYDYQKMIAEERGITFDPAKINYAAQTYLMVIRFYGYDELGDPISPRELDLEEKLSDSQAVAEKYIPFMFTNITYELTSDAINYMCECVCPNSLAPIDFMHARIPFNMTFQGETVKDILVGKSRNTNNHVVGLIEKLNAHQEKLTKDKNYEYPDVYEIYFEDDFKDDAKISTATVLPPGTTRFERTGFESIDKATEALLNERVKKGLRTYEVRSGMSLVQFIDFVLRTSSFITDQYEQSKDENTDTVRITNKEVKYLTWFKINTEVELGEFDRIRNDYAYKIKYIISRYRVDSLSSPYFTQSQKNSFGVHKEYNYWFSGENTEVLKFTQKFNYLWYQSMSSYFNPNKLTQNNLGTVQRRTFQTNPADSAYGSENASSNPAADAASDLYSPGDQAVISIEILGDPDFICQSELFYSPLQRLNSEYSHQPFLQDGSVNYDASEVYFTINYNTVVDYSLDSGLADVLSENIGRDVSSNMPGQVKHQFLYRANTITSKFIGGAFTQILDGTMVMVPMNCIVKLDEDQVTARSEQDGSFTVKTSELSSKISNKSKNMATKPQYDMSKTTYPTPGTSKTVTNSAELVISNGTALDTPREITGSISAATPEPQNENR